MAIINRTVLIMIDCPWLHVAFDLGYRFEKVGGYSVALAGFSKAEGLSGSAGKEHDHTNGG